MWLGKNTRSYIQLGRSIVLRLLLHPETTRENVWFWIGLENVPTEIGDMLGARLLRGFKIITVTDMVLRIDGLLENDHTCLRDMFERAVGFYLKNVGTQLS